jgi:dolichol-phosphate mannosyltransferase
VERLAGRRGVRQFVKFAIVGLSGLIVNLIVFTLLQRVVPNHAGGAEFTAIYSVAFLSGGVSNYFLNRAWTFRSTGHVAREGLSFMIVSVAALVVGLLVSAAIAPELGRGHKTWFISTIAGIVVNFFANKYWTFRAVR